MIRIATDLALRALIVLTGVAVATFALLWHAPGDPALSIAEARYGTVVSKEVLDFIRAEAGFDTGFWTAFWAWLSPLLAGDFGQSSVTGRDVWPDLVTSMSYTFPLALVSLAIGLAISIPLALVATRKPGSLLDRGAVALASVGVAVPAFWLGLLLILFFAVQLDWLPAMGAQTAKHSILPALTLALGIAASLTRIIRSGILEARMQPFLPAFQRRGVSGRNVSRDHVAPHAAVPVVTVLGLELAFLLEGLVVVEVIFARPGLGSFLVSAIYARDFPKVQAVVILTAVIFVTVNLLIDLIYRSLDPRVDGRNA